MENGYTDEIVCGVCGASLQDSEIIWALNHKYDKNAKWKKYKVTSTAAYQYKRMYTLRREEDQEVYYSSAFFRECMDAAGNGF